MMYFIMFHGQPNPDAEDIDNVGGAYINCYVQADSLDTAEKIARKNIKKMNWNILNCEDGYEIDFVSVSDEGRKYYEQALIDKITIVFHTYPKDEN